MIEKSLRQWLRPVVNRQKRLYIMKKLSLYWLIAAICGIVIIAADKQWGWNSPAGFGFLLIVTVFATIAAFIRSGSIEPDYTKLAREIEMHNPDLKATLLTAIEQKPRDFGGQLDYLQERVIGEALAHAKKHNWVESIPQSKFFTAGLTNAAVLIFFIFILSQLKMPSFSRISQNNPGGSPKPKGYEITVTPGDTTVELGTNVVILARFDGKVPDNAKLLVGSTEQDLQEIPFNKNLEDPVFGGLIQQINSDMVYHIEYDDKKTSEYAIKTYQHPALERADANIVYPAYTNLPDREIKDTLRIPGVVEGSKVTLTFILNKPVVTAQLISKDGSALNLTVNAAEPNIYTTLIEPRENLRYDLKLVDSDGRANKAPPRFVIDVLKNMPANLKLKFPNRDIEASPIEELTLEAEVSDDYGITSHGLSYILAGSEGKDITLGKSIAANKKQPVAYVLAMEDLRVQPDQLLSYYFWAEDTGPDSKTRRTVSDLYFTEIRSFEQIFRENQSFMDQNQQQREQQQQDQQGQEGMQNDQQRREQLVQLQKQIITATWNIKRQVDLSTTSGVENKKEDINLLIESQSDALEIARNGGDQSTGQGGGTGSAPGGRGGQGTRQGGRGGRGGMMQQSVGMNQINTETPSAPVVTSSGDPMEQAIQHMEKALEHLQETLKTSTSQELTQALASEQAAYQELLKLREQESQVARDRSGQRGNQNSSARQQQQLQQLEMRQRNDRYEMQREAQQQPQQESQQREDLQVLNRLRDLARRQSEMTDRLREAEAALREAQTEQERQQITRELERLRQEQIENMRNADELQQRMENQENRQRMSESAEQLSQTRERMQQSAEQMQQGQVSEAAANSTRAQRELEQMREEFQRSTSGQFSQQMQDMRQQARELDERQQQISQEMRQQQSGSQPNSLGQPGTSQDLAQRVQQQRDILEKLLEQMKEISEQSEESEPLLSRRLYDTYRQTSTENVDRALETTEELLRRNFVPQAQKTEAQASEGIQNLREGIEEAAQGVLGDEADSLRLARQQLDEAIRQIGGQGDPNQMQAQGGRRGQRGGDPNQMGNMQARGGTRGQRGGGDPNQMGDMQARGGTRGQRGGDPNQMGEMQARGGTRGQRGGGDPNQMGDMQARGGTRGQRGGGDPNQMGDMQARGGTRGQRGGGDPNQMGDMQARGGTRGQRGGGDPNQMGNMQARGGTRGQRGGGDPNQMGDMQARGGGGQFDIRQLEEQLRRGQTNPNGLGGYQPFDVWDISDPNNPLTGENFRQWFDRLREVEEMLPEQQLREQVATVRERARTIREDFTRNSKEPQWDMVKMDVVKPLTEVRNRISEELAKIDSKEAIVPIDRDPVPARYSDLVRAYYENLGGNN